MFGFRLGGDNVRMLDAEFCTDPDYLFRSHTTEFKMADGSVVIRKWISDAGLKRCKMKDATCLLTVGEKQQGVYVAGKYKTYWLKPIR